MRNGTWQRGYYDQPHVQQVTQAIEHWNDGLLTLKELLWRLEASYSNGYASGREDAHFPVPALRTETCFKMYYDKDRKPERLILGTWLIDRTELRYLLFVFKWRVMI